VSNESRIVENFASFARYLPNLSDSSMAPKKITLNDLEWPFCVKSVSGSASYGLTCSGFRTKLF